MATVKHASFGSLSSLVASGFSIPEGNYKLTFECKLWAPEKSNFPASLGVMVSFEDPDGEKEPKEKFYSFGRKVHEAFMVDPKSGGKKIKEIPGKEGNFPDGTKWSILLNSLYNAGLPEGHFVDDISVLDDLVGHVHEELEPEDWSKIQKSTGDAEAKPKQRGTIAVVTEFIDPPWEKGGKKKSKPPVKGKAEPEEEEEEEDEKPVKKATKKGAKSEEEELAETATELVKTVLEANEEGMAKIRFRAALVPLAKKALKDDEELVDALTDFLFSDDDNLIAILDQVGFELDGKNIVVKEEKPKSKKK